MPDDDHRRRLARPTSTPWRRQITQIAVAYNSDREIREDSLYCLCNDGSVWVMCWDAGAEDNDQSHWVRLADIPAD
jgi:hypothetical protein